MLLKLSVCSFATNPILVCCSCYTKQITQNVTGTFRSTGVLHESQTLEEVARGELRKLRIVLKHLGHDIGKDLSSYPYI